MPQRKKKRGDRIGYYVIPYERDFGQRPNRRIGNLRNARLVAFSLADNPRNSHVAIGYYTIRSSKNNEAGPVLTTLEVWTRHGNDIILLRGLNENGPPFDPIGDP